ncbi:peptidylprolyl isomerase [Collinsella sp. AGMB00827]|uniref:Peptidylprolyl isomerase n=1 Tax=Collinsella ureilytica TaxID=2869515 RepID=A0ABS7MK76_9ACTN|nr:peptidylprolyl isomerase [Collinsella urealyticum]MBY4797772.1 peptidylprolyl isomerase [Collinsella urealyticum]
MKIKRDHSTETVSAASEKRLPNRKQVKAGLSKTGKIILALVGAAAMLLSVTAMACSGVLNQISSKQSYQLTGGVAAVVNGTNITEDTVTKQIMNAKMTGGFEKDEVWASFLVQQGLTPESYREQVIKSIAKEFLTKQAVHENHVTISDEEIDESYKKVVEQYGGMDSFKKMMQATGNTEKSFRESLRESLLQDKLRDVVAPDREPTDGEIITFFNEGFDTYNNARRSENLLIKVDASADEATKTAAREKATKILEQIRSGEISFEDAVKENSDDTGSKESGGDVGWDKLTSFVPEYQQALAQLGKDQVSDVVETTYGFHLIKCTEVLQLSDRATSIDQLPESFRTYIANVLKTRSKTEDYNAWMDDYLKKADLKINPMPENVPYNVSLEGVSPLDESKPDPASPNTTDSSAQVSSSTEVNAGKENSEQK